MKFNLLTIAALFIHFATQGQIINGTIVDASGDPIPIAEIINLNSGIHTHSNENGDFSLNSVSIGDSLKFLHLSYEPRLFIIHTLSESLNIVLTEKSLSLKEVVISPTLNALNIITDVDLKISPVNSSQEILRQVPGLIIGQHAGGGKAEQVFLRGFDIDHGTDLTLTVDGIPVNMVSHAHGQGYSDLHFIIPETIDKIDFGKGPYYADKGDFNTAGYVNFKTKDALNNTIIGTEIGQFNTFRTLGMFDLINNAKQSGYMAAEYISTDGPFDSPQNFNRLNIFGKFKSTVSESDKISITFSHFDSKWDASGQIPERAVNEGLIGRFGAIDDTEGGNTGRSNILLDHERMLSENAFITNKFYYSLYDFELYSNFTFFLEDSINGDQIRQKENRAIFGLSSIYHRLFSLGNSNGALKFGLSLRNDQSKDNELSHTANRQTTITQYQLGNINQTNLSAFVDAKFDFNKWTFNPAIRVDYFDFQYNDALAGNYETLSETKSIISPKLNILYHHSQQLQFYLKGGKGFHSNDTRVVTQETGNEILPSAYGFDAGYIWKPAEKLIVNTAYWYLFLDQEFVYVGDAGIVEPSGETKRQGVDFSVRHQPLNWLFATLDATYSNARSVNENEGENLIPLAPELTLTGGLNFILKSGVYAGIKFRHIDDRPANEDNSIVAKGYSIIDVNTGYETNSIILDLGIQNLFNTDWNETQFATESRLQNEISPVEEIHFTPGTPFYFKAKIQFKF